MCSSNCVREFQKFWQNSMHALFLAASGHQLPSNSLQMPPDVTAAPVPQNYNYSQLPQTPFPKLTGLKSTHRRRRRRKRNRNKRLNQLYQPNSDFHNNNCSNNNSNVQMRVKSIVRYWMIYNLFASNLRFSVSNFRFISLILFHSMILFDLLMRMNRICKVFEIEFVSNLMDNRICNSYRIHDSKTFYIWMAKWLVYWWWWACIYYPY